MPPSKKSLGFLLNAPLYEDPLLVQYSGPVGKMSEARSILYDVLQMANLELGLLPGTKAPKDLPHFKAKYIPAGARNNLRGDDGPVIEVRPFSPRIIEEFMNPRTDDKISLINIFPGTDSARQDPTVVYYYKPAECDVWIHCLDSLSLYKPHKHKR